MVRCRLKTTPGAGQKEKSSSSPGASKHLRLGRQAQVQLEGGEEEEAREPERRGRPRPPSHSERAVVMMEILSASFLREVCLVAQRAGKVGSEDRHGRDVESLPLPDGFCPPSPAPQRQKTFTHALSLTQVHRRNRLFKENPGLSMCL